MKRLLLVATVFLLSMTGTAQAVKGGEHTTHAQYPLWSGLPRW